MKNALMVYPHNEDNMFNIGDYIQSIAARQFFSSIDLYIDRERMNCPMNESAKLIMNGWFMHSPQNWPPSEKIYPLFVAFHMNKLAEKEMLSPEGVQYLKKYEPIGCRDHYTVSLLKSKGIDAYFSGCMTLTLGQTYQHEKVSNAKIYFTDLDYTLKHDFKFKLKCLYTLICRGVLLRKIRRRMNLCGVSKTMRTVAAFYVTFKNVITDDLFTEATYLAHEIPDTFASNDEKFEYAEKLLKDYAKAKFVVSSRIHCALPCLAMGTPIVLVTNELSGDVHNCRLDGLKQLFHTINIDEEGIKSKIIGNSKLNMESTFTNKQDYKPLAEKLIVKCQSFVSED